MVLVHLDDNLLLYAQYVRVNTSMMICLYSPTSVSKCTITEGSRDAMADT